MRGLTIPVPQCLQDLPVLKDVVVELVNDPPVESSVFLMELIMAQKLSSMLPNSKHISLYSYRASHAFACLVEILNATGAVEDSFRQEVFNHLSKPWVSQGSGAPIVSKWKKVRSSGPTPTVLTIRS